MLGILLGAALGNPLPVEYVSSGISAPFSGSGSLTIPANPGANSLLLVFAVESDDAGSNNFTTITVGGASPTGFQKVVTSSVGSVYLDAGYAWFDSADYPSTGAQAVTTDNLPTANGKSVFGFILLDRVSQTTPLGTPSYTSETSQAGVVTKTRTSTLSAGEFVVSWAAVADPSAGTTSFVVSTPAAEDEVANNTGTVDAALSFGHGTTSGANDSMEFDLGSSTMDVIGYGYVQVKVA